MRYVNSRYARIMLAVVPFVLLGGCATRSGVGYDSQYSSIDPPYDSSSYSSRMPQELASGEKTVVVDPTVHAWAAYGRDGKLVRGGIATAGGNWCPDTHKPCRTAVGTFRVYSMGDGDCISKKYPLPRGGGLMPYCMYFNNGMALHGSPASTVIEDNVSHGCVRMRISDAEWLRYNFVQNGTKVVVKPY